MAVNNVDNREGVIGTLVSGEGESFDRPETNFLRRKWDETSWYIEALL